MARQKSVNGSRQILKALNALMKDLDQKVSIRVGIMGEQASQIHPDSDLTNAQLGAIHEFGATINVTDKMRAYLHHIGIHLKKDTTTITIPARSFLRDTFFTGNAKERLMDFAGLSESKDFKLDNLPLHTTKYRNKYKEIVARRQNYDLYVDKSPEFFMNVCNAIGAKALEMVQDSFRVGGYPTKWAPISEITRKNRKGDASNPPLNDTGELMDSITVEVKRVQ